MLAVVGHPREGIPVSHRREEGTQEVLRPGVQAAGTTKLPDDGTGHAWAHSDTYPGFLFVGVSSEAGNLRSGNHYARITYH